MVNGIERRRGTIGVLCSIRHDRLAKGVHETIGKGFEEIKSRSVKSPLLQRIRYLSVSTLPWNDYNLPCAGSPFPPIRSGASRARHVVLTADIHSPRPNGRSLPSSAIVSSCSSRHFYSIRMLTGTISSAFVIYPYAILEATYRLLCSRISLSGARPPIGKRCIKLPSYLGKHPRLGALVQEEQR